MEETPELAKAHKDCREALDKIRSQDEMLVIISHDLRSSLSVIQMTVDQLLMKETIEESQVFIAMIARHTDMALRMVNDIMDVNCLQRGMFNVEPVVQDLVAIVKECVHSVHLIAAANRVVVSEKMPDAILAYVDKSKLTRAIVNLLINAIKFSPINSSVQVTLNDHEKEAEFIVEDAGPGIPESMRNSIFGKYNQAKVDARGLGLGLYISKSIVESHKGKIWVEDAPNRGASFHFSIPKN